VDKGNFAGASEIFRAYVDYENNLYALSAGAIYAMMAHGLTEPVLADFEKCLALVHRQAKTNDFWSVATELNCLLALGRVNDVTAKLAELAKYNSARPEFDSATRYFDEIEAFRRAMDPRPEVQKFRWQSAIAAA
jgi:hypothetical protein